MIFFDIHLKLHQFCLEHRNPSPIFCELPDFPQNMIDSELKNSYGLIAANASLPQKVKLTFINKKIGSNIPH